MSELSPSLRKAAVLISALDPASADALLDQMSADDAAKVRRALVELDDIPADEQQQVLADFLRQRGGKPRTSDDEVTLEIDPRVEAQAMPWQPSQSTSSPPVQNESLDFLEQVEPRVIARLLTSEHPQTAAVVVSHLPPQQAAAVLQELPAELAMDALERIATIDTISPDVFAELARALRRQLAPHLRAASAGAAPLAHLSAVLQAMDDPQRRRLLAELGDRNAALLKRLGLSAMSLSTTRITKTPPQPRYRLDSAPPLADRAPAPSPPKSPPPDIWLTFDDLPHFSDAALKTIFASADTELVLLALTGADSRFIGRILRRMPVNDAALLRERLEHPSAVRLRDIEQARAALAAVASRLAHEGSLEIPPQLTFAAAA